MSEVDTPFGVPLRRVAFRSRAVSPDPPDEPKNPAGFEGYREVDYWATTDSAEFHRPDSSAWAGQESGGDIVFPRRFSNRAFNSLNEYWGNKDNTPGDGSPITNVNKAVDSDDCSEPYYMDEDGPVVTYENYLDFFKVDDDPSDNSPVHIIFCRYCDVAGHSEESCKEIMWSTRCAICLSVEHNAATCPPFHRPVTIQAPRSDLKLFDQCTICLRFDHQTSDCPRSLLILEQWDIRARANRSLVVDANEDERKFGRMPCFPYDAELVRNHDNALAIVRENELEQLKYPLNFIKPIPEDQHLSRMAGRERCLICREFDHVTEQHQNARETAPVGFWEAYCAACLTCGHVVSECPIPGMLKRMKLR